MGDDNNPQLPMMSDGQWDQVTYPDGRVGYVPTGFGQPTQAGINQMAQGNMRGNNGMGGMGGGNGAGTIGTFGDAYEGVTAFMSAGDMQRDLDDARDNETELNYVRETYAQLNDGATPPDGPLKGAKPGVIFRRLQQLQDKRDFLQERILSAQIRVNYGAGIGAGARVAGRVLGNGGGGHMDGGGDNSNLLLLGVAGLGMFELLSRDRDRDRGGGSSKGNPATYGV